MFGAFGSALKKTSITFVSREAYDAGIKEKYNLGKLVEPVRGTRVLTKKDLVLNSFIPKIEVNPQTFAVKVDGVHATVKPPKTISLNQLYFFS